jgi:hypothetical protein
MTTPTADRPRANVALVLLSILIGLILKGTLDAFFKNHSKDKGDLAAFVAGFPRFIGFSFWCFSSPSCGSYTVHTAFTRKSQMIGAFPLVR